jgi:voltage-gated potassium channel Kch
MTHSELTSAPLHLSFRLCIAAAIVVLAFAIGAWGMRLYETEHHGHADVASVLYHTLQLFILHAPHLEYDVNWQIHVGRWLAALVVFWALVRALAALFRSELGLFWTWVRGGHVIICGLGRLGRQLTAEYQRGGSRVVVIEADPNHATLAARSGVLVLNGDACDTRQLRRAGVTRARQLVAVCDDVQTNVAVATTAGEILGQSKSKLRQRRQLESWLFVPVARLRQLLKRDGLFPHTGARFRVNVRGLDLFSLAARQALDANPLDWELIDEASPKAVHLVVVGFGAMGQRLALDTAQVGHFANMKHPKITVLEQGSHRVDAFLLAYPKFKDLIDFDKLDFTHDSTDAAAKVLQASQPVENELKSLAICWDSGDDAAATEAELFRGLERDDAVNLSLALSTQQTSPDAVPRILLFQTRRCGFATLFNAQGRLEPSTSNVRVFGTLEETCSLDVLMHESTDAVARVLHQDWYGIQKRAGLKHGDKPSFWTWEQLGEIHKESNRHAADHIPVKLRAAGYLTRKLPSGSQDDRKRLTSFDGAEHAKSVELLAKMEHDRWCAELSLMGYVYAEGNRDDVAKTHPNLVSWDALDDGTKDFDRGQIKAIPGALAKLGQGIYPGGSLDAERI